MPEMSDKPQEDNQHSLDRLRLLIEERRNDANTTTATYIQERIERGWTPRQLIARLTPSCEMCGLRAERGSEQERQALVTSAGLYAFAIHYLEELVRQQRPVPQAKKPKEQDIPRA